MPECKRRAEDVQRLASHINGENAIWKRNVEKEVVGSRDDDFVRVWQGAELCEFCLEFVEYSI